MATDATTSSYEVAFTSDGVNLSDELESQFSRLLYDEATRIARDRSGSMSATVTADDFRRAFDNLATGWKPE